MEEGGGDVKGEGRNGGRSDVERGGVGEPVLNCRKFTSTSYGHNKRKRKLLKSERTCLGYQDK